ncbi:MAG: energy-coupling factor ABC transporter ATP-binding protein [Treponemataceae bacterium]
MEFIAVQNISKIFYPDIQALENISFTINEGDFVVIGGANGSGKSALMSILANLEEATSGNIVFGNQRSEKKKPRIGLIFQDADAQILGETCEEDILFGVRNLNLSKMEQEKIIVESLQKVDLLEKRFFQARFLSGGEKRRLSVASILAIQSEIIIFDEPFANLDLTGIQQVCTVLSHLQNEQKTVIVLTHEIEKVLARANKFLILSKGKLVFDGKPCDGLKQNLAQWGIRNPFINYSSIDDLWWGA